MENSFEDYLLDNFSDVLDSLTSQEIASLRNAFNECQSWLVAEQTCLKSGLNNSDIDYTNDFEKITGKRLEAQTRLNILAKNINKKNKINDLINGFSR